jgi:hypothetical protein
MKTKFNKKGETVITINDNEALIMRHILKQFMVNAKEDEGCGRYFITDGIASSLTTSEFIALQDMFFEVDGAVQQIIRR